MSNSSNVRRAVLLGATAVGLLASASAQAGSSWSFGLMSDTQWIQDTGTDNANNPNTVPVTIINQVNQQFINAGVKFVIQDGDLVDKYPNNPSLDIANEKVRATAAQPLYDAGIGFFPLRGNHDSPDNTMASLQGVQSLYPQMTGTGNAFGTRNFVLNPDGSGSYAFDYGNTRFVMLDQFTGAPTSGALAGTNINSQLTWLSSTLSTTTNPDPGVTNSFVLGHKNLIGGNHVDNLFGANPSSNPSVQNQFYSILAQNNVDAYIGGHDHMMQVDRVGSPDTKTTVTQIISGSDSNKFYIPAGTPPNTPYVPPDTTNAEKYGRTEDVVAQSLYGISYWIFTVDGADVYASYYEASPGSLVQTSSTEYLMKKTPASLDFEKLYTFKFENGSVTMVPEPSTWVMMAAGFAGLAFAGCRSSRKALDAA